MMFAIKWFLFVANYNIAYSKTFLEPEDTVMQCAKHIISEFPNYHTTLMHNTSKQIDNFVINLMSTRGMIIDNVTPELRTNPKMRFTDSYNRGSFVIMLLDNSHRMDFFVRTYDKYLIIYMGEDLLAFMKNLLDFIHAQSVKMLYYNHKTIVVNRDGEIFGVNEKYCTDFRKLRPLFHCSDLNLTAIRNAYEGKRTGCAIKVRYMKNPPFVRDVSSKKLPGVEVQILNEAARLQNISINYTDYGALSLILGDIDVVIGGIPITEGATYVISYPTYVNIMNFHMEDDIYLLTWLAEKQPGWKGMINAFEYNFWIAILTTVIAFWLITFSIANLATESEGYDSLVHSFLQLYSILISHSVKQPKFITLRILFMSHVLFSLIIASAYVGTFVSLILLPFRAKQPYLTLQDCVDSNLPVSCKANFLNCYMLYEFYSIDSDEGIVSRCGENCLEDVISYRNHAHITTSTYMETNLKHLMKLVFKIKAIGSYTMMGSRVQIDDVVKPIERTARKLVEGGLTLKWEQDMRSRTRVDDEDFVAINMDHLLLIFYIYIVGVIGCVMVFFAEVIYYQICLSDY